MPQIFALTNNIPNTSLGDGTFNGVLAGKSGELAVAELHGKWYTSAYRGRLFVGANTTSGVTIPIATTTTATFALYNPLGSGVNVEMVSCDVTPLTVTSVAASIGLGIVTGLLVAPTSLTAITPYASLLGGSAAPQAKIYSSAVLAAATTTYYPMFTFTATSGLVTTLHHEFDGKLVVPPGTLVHIVATAAQTQASANSFVWAEYPL